MKIGVMGAGAIGSYVGGRLAASGMDVVLVGRAALAGEIARHGVRLTDYRGHDVRVDRVRTATTAEALADRDIVLVTVKSGDTAAAAAQLAPVLGPGARVISLQNGVSNPAVLRASLRHVLGGMVPFNVLRQEGAAFHQGTSGRIAIEAGEGAEALAAALNRAGLRARVTADITGVLWGKLLFNLNNSVNALSGVPIREQLADRRYRLVMAACVREAIGLLTAAGIRPRLDPPLPPRLLPLVLALPDRIFSIVARGMLRMDAQARSSMWDDLSRGRRTEIDALNGEITRLGHAPMNAAIVALIKAAEGHGPPRMGAGELCAHLGIAI